MQKVCIIFPCYNEEKRLDIHAFSSFLLISENNHIDFCFVDDGSSDNTLNVINEFKDKFETDRVYTLRLDKNSGKAEAVRRGLLKINSLEKYNYIGFWDADLSTPLFEINNMLDFIKDRKIIIGSRMKRLGASINRNDKRHILGRVFSTLSSWILKLPVYDTQCGAKIFHCSIVDSIFNQSFNTKWLFDVEFLARYRNIVGEDGVLTNVVEYPLKEWKEVKGSKLKLADFIKVPFELLVIHNKYN